MSSWSPFRKDTRNTDPAPRARGRRRQRFISADGDLDAVLSDTDAAHAALSARMDRARPGTPAWERFRCEPVTPRPRQPDAGDTVLKLRRAESDGMTAVMGKAMPVLRASRASRDYGTGPAYDPAKMR